MNSGSENSGRKKIAVTIFASGGGTNAENCIIYFQDHEKIQINLIVSNQPGAGVIEKAVKHHVPVKVFSKDDWEHPEKVIAELHQDKTDWIVLAGYLNLLPPLFIKAFRGKIINLHPALLPKFGGKGMYGKHVHRAVIGKGETETGITIHEVNEEYDKGKILFQKSIPVTDTDTSETIEKKIRKLEYYYLPRVIESILLHQPLQ